MEKLDVKSLDIENIEKEKLQSIFPQCFVEGKLNVDKLLNLCGEYIDNDYEKYEFTWKGKVESLKKLIPTRGRKQFIKTNARQTYKKL